MSSQSLNESKFLSQQINSEEDPTEEEIIEKAQELGISDLGLARQALTKELDAQWKPYINRRGEVYYINLEERKAYLDHPVDMEIAITDALRHRKKVPVFREFAIEEISRSPRLVQQEIARYTLEKGLNVVYEESDEESLRRDTLQSVEDPLGQSEVIELDRGELEVFRIELERQMRAQLAAYRAEREGEYGRRVKLSGEVVEQSKRARLMQLAAETEKEITVRNDVSFQRSTQATRDELLAKRDRLDDLHSKQLEIAYKLMNSRQTKQEEVRTFYRTKRYHNKQKLLQNTHSDLRNSLIAMARTEAEQASQEYSAELVKTMNAKINMRERLFQNIQQLRQPSKSRQMKKRYPIFNTDLFCPEKQDTATSTFHSLTDRLKINESIHQKPVLPVSSQLPRYGPSLFLRLSLRIL